MNILVFIIQFILFQYFHLPTEDYIEIITLLILGKNGGLIRVENMLHKFATLFMNIDPVLTLPQVLKKFNVLGAGGQDINVITIPYFRIFFQHVKGKSYFIILTEIMYRTLVSLE
jgi:hypothetical protein